MFEQDYMKRMIKDMARFLARIILNKDTVTYELTKDEIYTKTDYVHRQLLSLIMQGKINEAENMLHEEFKHRNERCMELALDFYSRLNDLDDEFLMKNNFTREEIEQGLKEIVKRYGILI